MANDNLTFRGQREDEEVISLIHQHPWALAKPGLVISLGLVVIILMFVYFQASKPAVWTLFILGPVLLVYGGYRWFLWWNNLYLVTNQRVIVLTRINLWNRQIDDYGLDKIQSVASTTTGPAGTMLNFGEVMLAIMGIKDRVRLPYVEDPYAVQEKILTAMKKLSGVTINEYQKPKKHRPELR